MKQSTRLLLEEAFKFGRQNSGRGYSTAMLIQRALENEDDHEVLDERPPIK
jgi:hypothetical protein